MKDWNIKDDEASDLRFAVNQLALRLTTSEKLREEVLHQVQAGLKATLEMGQEVESRLNQEDGIEEQAQKLIKRMQKKCCSLLDEVDAYRNKVERRETALDEIKRSVGLQVEDLHRKIFALNDAIVQLKSEKEIAEEECRRKDMKISQLQLSIQHHTSTFQLKEESLTSKIQDLENKLKEQPKPVPNAEYTKGERKSETIIVELKAALEEERLKRMEAEQSQLKIQEKLSSLETAFSTKNEETKMEAQRLRAKIHRLMQNVALQQESCSTIQQRKVELDKQIATITLTLAEEQANQEILRQENRNLERKILSLTRDISRFKTRLVASQKKYRKLLLDNNSNKKLIRDRSSQIKNLKESIVKLRNLSHSIKESYELMLKEIGKEVHSAVEAMALYKGTSLEKSPWSTLPTSEFGQWFIDLQSKASWLHRQIRELEKAPTDQPMMKHEDNNKRKRVAQGTKSKHQGRISFQDCTDGSLLLEDATKAQERYLRFVQILDELRKKLQDVCEDSTVPLKDDVV